MTDSILLTVLAVNGLLSLVYTLAALRSRQRAWLGLLFFFVPVLGFCMYYGARAVVEFVPSHPYDRENLVRRYEIHRMEKDPELERELDVIPVEDAMAVGSTSEKRGLLLDQLKKDMQSNYKYLLPASADSDSESAHYVAAGMMEVYRIKQLQLQKLKDQLRDDPEDLSLRHQLLQVLGDYMDSGLITPKEAMVFKNEYCACFEDLAREDRVTAGENALYVTYLIDLRLKDRAADYWNSCPDSRKNEYGYRKMLDMYYNDGNRQQFYSCLQQLKESDIILSPEGVNMVRFWSGRGESDPIG